MNNLSIEELKDVVANAKTSLEQYLALELIKLKGDQVPVAWFTDDKEVDKSATTYSEDVARRWLAKGWPVGELFTHSQKLTDLPYDVLFNAIAKSVTPLGEHMSISVKDFKAAIEAAGSVVKDGE